MVDWYKDAVIYELHVRSFVDSDGDGMGDFRGLTARLDYLQDLGVTAIWLLPFYPSPWRDDGYDIADYRAIHSTYGTMRDFKRFLSAAHARGLRVITELVINHTSTQHPWFERARRAPAGSRWRNFYVWSDTPERYQEARIIFQDFESSNWTWDPVARAYYWHRFYSHQPDLNFDNPEVQEEVLKLLDFWFELGVDGLRLDAIPYLFERDETNCENLPETHAFLKVMRARVDKRYPDRMLLAEANQWPEDAVAYFGEGRGDECHMAFHFPLMPRLFMALRMEDSFPVIDILEQTPQIPETSQWGIFLRNHDELTLEMVTDEERDYMYRAFGRDPRHRINLGIRRRLAPLLDNNRRGIELLNSLLFSLPGTPVIYYGDELGMGDNVYLGDRDGVRTPMQWSPDRNAGFSAANPQKLYLPLIIDPEYHYESINVETQQGNASSLLWWMKRLIATRCRYQAFSRGDLTMVSTDNHRILAFVRSFGDERVLVVVNFSRHTQVVACELHEYAGYRARELFSQSPFPAVRDEPYTLTIGSNDFYWILLERVEVAGYDAAGGTPISCTDREWRELRSPLRQTLETQVLPGYIRGSRWFREKSLSVRRMHVEDAIAVGSGDQRTWALSIGIDFSTDEYHRYLVPLAVARGEEAATLRDHHPAAVVADITIQGQEGLLYDGVYSRAFRDYLLNTIVRKRRVRTDQGALHVDRGRLLKGHSGETTAAIETHGSRVLTAEQSNTSILYHDQLFLKLFRKLEAGTNPDVELMRHLSETRTFDGVPPYAASLDYENGAGERATLGLVIGYVPNQGDAWQLATAAVDRYLERVLVEEPDIHAIGAIPSSPLGVRVDEVPSAFLDLAGGFFMEMIELLGRRTGELHRALAADRDDPAFAPEPFSRLYQRSLYQSLRGLARRIIGAVRRAPIENPDLRAEVAAFVAQEEKVLSRFARVTEGRITATKIRIHGDFHLGQVLFSGRDFTIIDLEGEPGRTMSERRLKFSAFRDIAGMLRSFHYAISGRYQEQWALRPNDAERLQTWIRPWYTLVSGTFLAAYLETVGDAPFVPQTPDQIATLLDVFLLEKAVYEVGYEINNRPDWLPIPLEGVRFVLDET